MKYALFKNQLYTVGHIYPKHFIFLLFVYQIKKKISLFISVDYENDDSAKDKIGAVDDGRHATVVMTSLDDEPALVYQPTSKLRWVFFFLFFFLEGGGEGALGHSFKTKHNSQRKTKIVIKLTFCFKPIPFFSLCFNLRKS